MTVNEFVELINKDPDRWNHYCEIIITATGYIELARPSHQRKLIEIYCDKEGESYDEFNKHVPRMLNINDTICEKYNLISVWYDYIIYGGHITKFQMRVLAILTKKGIINIQRSKKATEYSWYRNNKDRIGEGYYI